MIEPLIQTNTASVAAHYDDLDEFYRAMWGNHVHHGFWQSGSESQNQAVEALVDLVAQKGQIKAGQSVCDIGSGYGETARYLHNKYQANVQAFTVSKAQYQFALTQSQPDAGPRYYLQDWCENSVPDNSVDVAISIESSEHFPDKIRLFKEIYRVLKPGGRVVVCAWLSGNNPNKYFVKHLLEPICREGRLPGMGTAEEYEELLGQCGFPRIQHMDISNNVKRTWTLCIANFVREFLADKKVRKYLFDKSKSNRIFAKTVFRIWLAYELKAMRYGIFWAQKN